MKALFELVHHRSLAVSLLACGFADIMVLTFLPEGSYQSRHDSTAHLTFPAVATALVMLFWIFSLIVLLRDHESGYPVVRCSLAASIWALSGVPVFILVVWMARILLT